MAEGQRLDWRTRFVLWILRNTNPWHDEMEEDRRRMRQLAKDSSEMFRRYSNQERFNIQSRRSLCEQSDALQNRINELTTVVADRDTEIAVLKGENIDPIARNMRNKKN